MLCLPPVFRVLSGECRVLWWMLDMNIFLSTRSFLSLKYCYLLLLLTLFLWAGHLLAEIASSPIGVRSSVYCISWQINWLIDWVMLTCRYWQSGTSANRVGMYKYISHRLALIFKLKPLQWTSPVHCMAHWATSGKPPTPIRLTTLLGSSTAHVQLLSGIVKTGMNDFSDFPIHVSQ